MLSRCRCGDKRFRARSARFLQLGGIEFGFLVRFDSKFFVWLRGRIREFFLLVASQNIILLRRSTRDLNCGRCPRLGVYRSALAIGLPILLFLLGDFLWLREAMLEKGGGAGPLEAGQATLFRLSGVRGGEGRGAGRVVDVEVVFVPIAPIRLQPSFLNSL